MSKTTHTPCQNVHTPRSSAGGIASQVIEKIGGARRDRTDDLLLAKQALSQLSYGPIFRVYDGKVQDAQRHPTDGVIC